MFHFSRHKNQDADKSDEKRSHESHTSHGGHGSHHGSAKHGSETGESHPTHHQSTSTSGHGDPLLGATHGHHSTRDPLSGTGHHEHHEGSHGSQSTTDAMRQKASEVGEKVGSAAGKMTGKSEHQTGSTSSDSPAYRLQDGLRRSAEQTAAYLQSLKEVVTNHDREHQTSSSSSSEMHRDISSAESAVEAMKRLAEDIRRKGNSVSDDMMAQARASVEDMMNKLNRLSERSRSYEETQPSTGPSTMQVAKDKLYGATHSVQLSAVNMMNTTREKAQSGFEALKRELSSSTKESSTKESTKRNAQTAKDKTAGTVHDAKEQMAGATSSSQERQGPGMKEKAAHMLNTSLDYVADTLHGLKVESAEPSTTDKAKDKAHQTVEKGKDKVHEMTSDSKTSRHHSEQSPIGSQAP